MSQTEAFGVRRFGIKEASPSKSGESRLNKYLQCLKQNESETNNKNNNSQNDTINPKKSIKRKLNDDTLDNESKSIPSSPPHKKIKLSVDQSNPNNIQLLSIDDNINQQSIHLISKPIDIDIIEPKKDREQKKNRKKKKKQKQHHPIYDITSFPSINLPEIINPEKTLMPQPIWMKKGNKIISDIADNNGDQVINSLNSLRLDSRLINVLKTEGYKSYFPVQKNVIPAVIRGIIQKRDIAVCAPTGSGKTLSYILPICHILCKELSDITHHLRALIVSPSRDLALQIYLEFEKFAKSVGLKVGLSAGQRSLKEEQSIIINNNVSSIYESSFMHKPSDIKDNNKDKTAIDILICTPGRLVDHLNHTQGFNLNNLQFLILDEADRLLLEGSYQDWLFRVYHILESRQMIEKYKFEDNMNSLQNDKSEFKRYNNKICLSSRKSSYYEYKPYLLKILLSATLTHNPKIISSLKLNNPLYFGSSTNKQYLIPSSIQQLFICCFNADKLCNFISLIDILQQHKKTAVCFCDTVDIAHRLKRVIEIVFNMVHKQTLKVAEFSRMVPDRQRPRVLRQFRANKLTLLICSDAMSRGLDVPSLDCVINYECPKNIETYVHRIGRTARGIGHGTAYTILMQKEKKVIREMLNSVENGDKLKEHDMEMKVIRFHRKYMDKYTEILNNVLNKEENGDLDHNEAITLTDIVMS